MEQIGRRLQAARLARGLTLQHAEDETRIRKKYIEALESGRIADIPGEVYVKGFLRTYANYLGLEGEALVEEFKLARQAAEPAPPQPDAGRGARPAAAAMPEPPKSRLERPERVPQRREAAPVRAETEPSLLGRGVVGLLLAVALAGLAWWGLGKLTARSPEPPPAVQGEKEPVVSKRPDPVPQPPPEPVKPTVTMTGPKGESVSFDSSVSPVTVRMEGFKDGFPWMQVWVYGKEQFQGKPSGPVEYSGKEVIIRAGHMVGVDLVVGGEKFVEPLKGGPYTITFTGK